MGGRGTTCTSKRGPYSLLLIGLVHCAALGLIAGDEPSSSLEELVLPAPAATEVVPGTSGDPDTGALFNVHAQDRSDESNPLQSVGMKAEEGTGVVDFEPVPLTASMETSTPQPFEYGYENGVFFRTREGAQLDEKTIPFELKFNLRMQLRLANFESSGPNPDETNFELEYTRYIFSGYAFTTDLQYFFQLDGDSDQREVMDVLDAFFRYDFGHSQHDLKAGTIGLFGGKLRTPFSRARREPIFKLHFIDLSMAHAFFDLNRSVGVGLYGQFDLADQPVAWEVMLNNGFQNQGQRPGRQGDLDQNPGLAGRVRWDPFGEWGPNGEPDLKQHERPALRLGAGLAFTRIDNEGQAEFNRTRVVDSGQALSSLLPANVQAYNSFQFAADANFKYRGLSVIGEFYSRQISGFSGAAVPELRDFGTVAQAGYFVVPEKLEFFVRHSHVWGDSGTLGVQNQSADEVAAGFAYYIRGYNLRIVGDVSQFNGSPVQASPLNLRTGDRGLLFRTMFQVLF